MSRKTIIEEKLAVLNPHILEVVDKSQSHASHSGNPNGTDGTHFIIRICADKLDSMNKIEQHRTINNLLKDEFDRGLHALSINIILKDQID